MTTFFAVRFLKEFVLDEEGQIRLLEFFDRIGEVLGREERKASFALYAMGLFGDGDREVRSESARYALLELTKKEPFTD